MQQYFQIPSTETTQQKAVVDSVIDQVFNSMGIARTNVVFTDPHWNTAHDAGGTVGDTTEVKFEGSDFIEASVEEERDPMERIARGIGRTEERMVFVDKDIEVTLAPVRTRYNTTVTLRRTSSSRDLLLRWINNLNSLIDMGQQSIMVEAESYYLLPKNAIWVLWECWKASEVRVKRFDTFREFLNNGLDASATEVVDMAGTNKTAISFRCNHTRIEVVLDATEPEWNEEAGVYFAMFVIRFTYQRPEEVVVSYHHIINQTALPEVLRPQIDPPWVSNEEMVERSQYRAGVDQLAYFDRNIEWIRLPYSLLPLEQIQRINYPLRQWEVDVFASDILFQEDNMVNPTLFDLDDLPYVWDEHIAEYIRHCRLIDPTGMTGIIRMRLFSNSVIVDPKNYKWVDGETMNVEFNVDIKRHYFLLESALRDWRSIDLYPLQLYPKAAILLLRWLHPKFNIPPRWEDQDKLTPGDMDEIEDHLREDDGGRGTDKRLFFTVAHTSIITMRG